MPIKPGNEGVGVQSVALFSLRSCWLVYLLADFYFYFFPYALHQTICESTRCAQILNQLFTDQRVLNVLRLARAQVF